MSVRACTEDPAAMAAAADDAAAAAVRLARSAISRSLYSLLCPPDAEAVSASERVEAARELLLLDPPVLVDASRRGELAGNADPGRCSVFLRCGESAEP